MSQNIPSDLTFDPTTFDHYPELYDEVLNWPYRQELEFPTLKNLLGDLTGSSVLDFGCGPGVITRWLHEQGAQELTGFDISEGMLSYAQNCENQKPLGIRYTSAFNDQDNETFDVILAVYVIPYLPKQADLTAMFESIFKMLKPGGRFITLPIHPEFNADAEYYAPFGFNLSEVEPRKDGSKLKLEIRMPPHQLDLEAYYWSRNTLNSTLNHAGFKDIDWPALKLPANLTPALMPYYNSPHVAIIQAYK